MGKSIGSLIAQSSMKHVDLRDPMLGVVDKDRDEEHSLDGGRPENRQMHAFK